jgi:hypothetical protein
MSYDITLRPRKRGAGSVARRILESRLASLPNVTRQEEGVFGVTNNAGEIVANLYMAEGDPVSSIEVAIPHSRLGSYGEAVQHLAADFAEGIGWGYFDEQIGAFLQREDLSSPPRKQLTKRAFWDDFGRYFSDLRLVPLIFFVVLGFVLSGSCVIYLGFPETFIWWGSTILVLAGLVVRAALKAAGNT